MVNYGGDEVSALVIDIGSSSLRAGYAGTIHQKAIIPTSYGYRKSTSDSDVDMTDGATVNLLAHDPMLSYSLVRTALGSGGENMEVGNPITDGLIQDFNPIKPLIEHALADVMRCNPSEHPILVTEAAWNTPANRERMAEIMFEEFQVPAFYIANTGVLNAFAAGRGSALVIDVGQNMASVTPVVDGFVLRKPVEPGVPPQYSLRQDRIGKTTESWRVWAENREVDEWIQSVASVLDQGWNDQLAASRPPKQYEFPTGFNTYFGAERLSIGEQFFFHSPQMTTSNPNLPKHIPALMTESLRECDPELRQVLMGNVVLTGGGSLFTGFAERLNSELSRSFPHTKIHAAGNPIERRYGGWLGGSILASLGTFHQLWISKEEWQDHGKAIVGQRCK